MLPGVFCAQSEHFVFHVKDDRGEPIPGVMALAQDTDSLLASSDFKGQIEIPKTYCGQAPCEIRLHSFGMQAKRISLREDLGSIILKHAHQELGEVVITGNHDGASVARTVHRVEVVTAKEIEAMGANDIIDVLQQSAEIQIRQEGAVGTSLSLQGLSDRNVKVTINEVPVVGRIDGKIDLTQIDLQDIEQIEIVRGPMAVSYGTDAIAGVVNIITKQKTKSQASLRAYYSSEGQYDLNLRQGASLGDYSYALRIGRRFFDGWAASHNTFSNPNPIADERRDMLWLPKEQYQGGLQHGIHKKNWSLTHRIDIMDERLYDRGTPQVNNAAESIFAFDTEYHTQRIDNSLNFSRKGEKGQVNRGFIAFNLFNRVRRQELTDVTSLLSRPMESDTTQYQALNGRFTQVLNIRPKMSLQLGADGSWESSTGQRIEGRPDLLNLGVFSTLEWALHERVIIRPGLRGGYNDRFDIPLIPSIAASYRWDRMSLKASYGQGYRAPDFKELYLAFFDTNHNIFGNAELSPEESHNANVAIDMTRVVKGASVRTELSAFYNDVDGLITLVQVGEGLDGVIAPFSYRNIESVTTQGLRLDFSLIEEQIEFKLGAGLIGRDQYYDEDTNTGMNYFAQANVTLGYRSAKRQAGVKMLMSYQGEQDLFFLAGDAVEFRRQEAFSMMDVNLNKRFWDKRLNLQLGVRNLLDVQNLTNATNGSHAQGTGTTPFSTGRNYFIAMDFAIISADKR